MILSDSLIIQKTFQHAHIFLIGLYQGGTLVEIFNVPVFPYFTGVKDAIFHFSRHKNGSFQTWTDAPIHLLCASEVLNDLIALHSIFLSLLLLFFCGKLSYGKWCGVSHLYAEIDPQCFAAGVASLYPYLLRSSAFDYRRFHPWPKFSALI